jgi:hypothetical protein
MPADDDGSGMLPFTDRQELRIPGDSTGEDRSKASERQALRIVRKML